MAEDLLPAPQRNGGMRLADAEPPLLSVIRDPRLKQNMRKFVRAQYNDQAGVFDEIGTTGLKQYGGFVLEEWLVQLQGRRAAWAYREMIDNDAVVGAILFAIEQLARGVAWRVTGGGKSAERAEFIESCMHDMTFSWLDTISEILSFLPYGWSFHELVYKRRNGPQRRLPDQMGPYPFPNEGGSVYDQTREVSSDEPASSEFKDGKIGWRKIPGRAQETLLRWHVSGYGSIVAMEQIDWHGGDHVIPLDKALLFRTTTKRNNPEGRSILRNAWTSFYRLQNIQQIEAIGIERDLAGLPVLAPPEGIDLESPSMAATKAVAEELLRTVKKDENQGILLPSEKWRFELVSAPGARQVETNEVIQRYEKRIASSVLADWILTGQDGMGSFAMVDIKGDMFGIALDTILKIVCTVFNKYAIPRLLALNGMDTKEPPEITCSSAGRLDLEKVGRFFQSVALAGGPIPWSQELMEELFKEAGLPCNYTGQPLETQHNSTGDIHELAPMSRELQTRPGLEQRNGQRAQGPRNDERQRQAKRDYVEGRIELEDYERILTQELLKESGAGVTPVLGERQALLAAQLQAEMQGALGDLGTEASTALLHDTAPVNSTAGINKAVERVLGRVDVKGWVEGRLMPLMRNHAGRTALDAQRILQRELGVEMHLDQSGMREVTKAAGAQMQVGDIEPQVRGAIVATLRDGLEKGEPLVAIAQRVQEAVPSGRYTKAGPAYRAESIAKNETANIQRQAVLELYKSSPLIVAIRLRDGIYGPPRSDQVCMDRDGEVVPIEQADSVTPYHPLCTLGFEPVFAQ